jgi:site-specific DNA recombinase
MAPNNRKIRVIGYVRISDENEESTSIARQIEVVQKYAAGRDDLELIDTLEDVSYSASKLRLNRPGLLEARKRVAQGEADGILVWRLDRVARSVVDFGTLIEEGTHVISATENLDMTTPLGRAFASILQVFAEMEAATIKERVRQSVDYLRRVGRFAGGVTPYGYQPCPHPDGRGRALEPNPEEAKIVREMVDRILAGESRYSIARDLTQRKIPTRRGAEWSVTGIARIVTSDVVLGRAVIKGEVVRDEDGIPIVAWEPLITQEESQMMRAIVAKPSPNGEPSARRVKAARLLSGVLICQSCGHRLKVGKAKETVAYTCRRPGCPRFVSVGSETIEQYVTAQFLDAFGSLPVIERKVLTKDVAGLAEVEEAIRHTTSLMAEPGQDPRALLENLERLRDRREALADQPSETVVEMVETGKTFAEEWETQDTLGRRLLLQHAIETIIIKPIGKGKPLRFAPERVEIIWHE